MAAKLNLWDKEHPGGQKQVTDCPELEEKLDENSKLLMKKLQITQDLWTRLEEKHVADRKTKDKIMSVKSRKAQIFMIMAELCTGRVFQVHSFLWALVNTGQFDLVSKMGFEVGDYIDDDIFTRNSAFKCPACFEFYTKTYILTGCQHYVCSPCVKGAQFLCKKDGKKKITCPVPECGKVTTTKHVEGSQIGLDEDEPFTTLTNIVKGALERQEKCGICEKDVPRCENEHVCTTCEKVLCMACYITHDKSHTRKRKHRRNKCCYHGYPVAKACKTCDTYYSKNWKNPYCFKHELNDSEGKAEIEPSEPKPSDNGEVKKEHEENMIHLEERQTNWSAIRCEAESTKKLISSLKGKFPEKIKQEQKCFRKHIKRWGEEMLEEWSQVNNEVDAKLAKCLQWTKGLNDLKTVMSAQPWRFTKPDDVKGALTEIPVKIKETLEYVSKVKKDGTLPDEKRFLSYFKEQKHDLGECLGHYEEPKCVRSSGQTFEWLVEGLDCLKRAKNSKIFIRHNCPWYLQLRPPNTDKGQGENLTVSLHLVKIKDVETELKSCTADSKWRLLTWDSNKEPHTTPSRRSEYVAGGAGWGFPKFISMADLLNPDNSYVKDGRARLEVTISNAVPQYNKQEE